MKVDSVVACSPHEWFAFRNWTLFYNHLYLAYFVRCLCRWWSTRKLDFPGLALRKCSIFLVMLGSTADPCSCVSKWRFSECFRIFHVPVDCGSLIVSGRSFGACTQVPAVAPRHQGGGRVAQTPGTTTASSCEQNTHSYSMYRCAQCVSTYTEQYDHISSREHAWLKSAQLRVARIGVLKLSSSTCEQNPFRIYFFIFLKIF